MHSTVQPQGQEFVKESTGIVPIVFQGQLQTKSQQFKETANLLFEAAVPAKCLKKGVVCTAQYRPRANNTNTNATMKQ